MSRSRGKSYHHGDLKRALLEAARAIIEAEGPDALTFRRLAEAAEVSHAAPLAHFPDRASLDAAVAARCFRELKTALEGGEPKPPSFLAAFAPSPAAPRPLLAAHWLAPKEAPPSPGVGINPSSKRLVAAGVAYLQFALEHPGLYRIMSAPELSERLRAVDPADRENPLVELLREKSEAFGVFVGLVREGQQAGDFRKEVPADQAARLFIALTEGLAQQFLAERPRPSTARLQDAERSLKLLLAAIESRPAVR